MVHIQKTHIRLLVMTESQKCRSEDFPGGAVVKNLPANAGDMGWIP